MLFIVYNKTLFCREGTAIVAVEKKVYLFGGSSGDTVYFNDLYELDMSKFFPPARRGD